MVQPLTIDQIQKNHLADLNWRMRRHPQWTSNYELYRDTVIINRLTQRQSVNVPYMKKTLKTYLTQTNWPVDNEYEDKGNDGQKALFLNAYWTECADRLRLDILEEVDRKQEWLYGRSFMKKTFNTYLTQTNWPVDNEYEHKGNDGQKALFLNAYWTECADRLRLDILEEVDRKQEWLYGRSFMKLN